MAVLVLAALGGALLTWQRPWQTETSADVAIPADAASRLASQFRALSSARTEESFVAAAGDTGTARAFAGRAWKAREALRADDVGLRYISGGEVADRGDGSAEAKVEVSWTPGGESGLRTARQASAAFRVLPQADGRFAIVSVRPAEGALPIWLAGAVSVDRERGAVVIRVDGGDKKQPVESMASAALSAVDRIVPGADKDVTIVSANTQGQMARLVGRRVGEISQIAAITTKLDGRSGTAVGSVIILNPAVFATMDRRAAQIVMTHEATHLLTRAAGTRAASWVVEGFADFVALHDDSASLSVSAGHALRRVSDEGAPARLPTTNDFGATTHGLGTAYESAWLIFRMLGKQHSDQEIIEFYETALQGTKLSSALRTSFGLTERQLTSQWQAYLTKSASTVS